MGSASISSSALTDVESQRELVTSWIDPKETMVSEVGASQTMDALVKVGTAKLDSSAAEYSLLLPLW